MGLDMYLYCNSKRVCQEANEGDYDAEWNVQRGIAVYWRKANAIHKWFVDNIQGGVDDCRNYDVGIEDLCRLHDTCKEVLESRDEETAKRLLPTAEGFFFGSTAYDEGYWWDLQHTVDGVSKAIANLEAAGPMGWREVHKDEPDWFVRFEYTSSW